MTEDEADQVLEPLVVAFSFTEDRYVLWREQMMKLGDLTSAQMAAAELIRDHTGSEMPGWGRFQTAYDRFLNRARLAASEELRALEQRTATYPTVDEGIEIARKAYIAECERQHREPNHALFAEMVDPVARQARRQQASWRGQRR